MNEGRDWDEYYTRTHELPSPERTHTFLHTLPPQSHILDFGCGTGSWAAAFLRDRPDLTIDVIDRNLDKAIHITPDWKGRKWHGDFRTFKPACAYDAIWARASLFFLAKDEIEIAFGLLASALKAGGVITFTLVDATPAAQKAGFTGMSEAALKTLLAKNRLTPLSLIYNAEVPYGAQKLIVPTFIVHARKTEE